ncbi:hypothetical protein JAAARDRAFT_691727 [Jaapia argillacea MUCL 33604]|uniref:Uncharacterized protein n=1 Tax=Jaapia argillacea MUCL 33604 TaxID=933084 RepID=A0A067PWR2_9AGAM|nr:hypothetical protein JAAARDRAFT_691727 [Jaapia argillacea MUCL 33604]
MEKCGVDEKSSGSKPRSKGKNKKRCRVTSDDNSEDGGVGVERRSVDPAEKKSSAVCTTPRLENRHAELEGLLIETFATSRASSMPPSSLYRTVVASRPALKSQRDKNEWIEVIGDVLEEARKRCGVFERVESSGKASRDDSDRPLESRWFYVPEKDEDQERAELIRSMMPRLDKRSETKKYKQYYWRPLDKISRWDAEDEM